MGVAALAGHGDLADWRVGESRVQVGQPFSIIDVDPFVICNRCFFHQKESH